MNDLEFVEFCYRHLLGREPDPGGRAGYEAGLKRRRLTRDQVLLAFVNSDEYVTQKASSEWVSTGHFYSAVPSRKDRDVFINRNLSDQTVHAVDLNDAYQTEFRKKLLPHILSCPFSKGKTPEQNFYLNNPGYSYGDALVLYGMIAQLRPKKIIEVGSGYSSAATIDAIKHLRLETKCTFIEPYPELLRSLLGESIQLHTLLSRELQTVDPQIFETLGEGDILFIDSTHVLKLNSDVNVIFAISCHALRRV